MALVRRLNLSPGTDHEAHRNRCGTGTSPAAGGRTPPAGRVAFRRRTDSGRGPQLAVSLAGDSPNPAARPGRPPAARAATTAVGQPAPRVGAITPTGCHGPRLARPPLDRIAYRRPGATAFPRTFSSRARAENAQTKTGLAHPRRPRPRCEPGRGQRLKAPAVAHCTAPSPAWRGKELRLRPCMGDWGLPSPEDWKAGPGAIAGSPDGFPEVCTWFPSYP
jgi:hypothetical protein